MKRLRKFFESIAFAGLRPTDDPLYLTNRTFGQRARFAAMVTAPVVVVGVILYLALANHVRPHHAPPPAPLTPEQIAEKMLPDLNKEIVLQSNHDLEVLDVHVVPGTPMKLAGTVRNNGRHLIYHARVVFDLTDTQGSRLGAVSTTVARVDPGASTAFLFAIPQRNAAFAIVREVEAP